MVQRMCGNCGSPLPATSDVCYACGRPNAARDSGRFAVRADDSATQYHAPFNMDTDATQLHPSFIPHVEVTLTASDGREFKLVEDESILGRVSSNAVVIEHPRVSRQHARILRYGEQVMLEDLQSTNGTYLNGERMYGPLPVQDGDVIALGADSLTLKVAIRSPRAPSPPSKPGHPGELHSQPAQQFVEPPPPPRLMDVSITTFDGAVHPLLEQDSFLGRVSSNTVQINSPQVSRQHARIIQHGTQVLLEDLQSTNGTFLNGERVTAPTPLKDGDAINLGNTPVLRVAIKTFVSPVVAPPEPVPPPPPRAEVAEAIVSGRPRLRDVLDQRQAPASEMISLRNVVKRYKTGDSEITILKGISLDIHAGDYVVLLGPSGCGKTTTLNMIIGADRPDSGEVIVAGQAINRLKEQELARWRGRYIGVVFQFFQLLPTLNVVENVMLPMQITKTYPRRERRARAMQYLELVGMAAMADRFPSALSGGQQQRVAIARALSCDPPILVADEPTGNLDSANSQMMFDLFVELNAAGKTIVLVTHDPVLARSVPHRVEMLDGEIVG
jgi:putative ABC transport system ATP-binding protein